jgi:hypothetical protein
MRAGWRTGDSKIRNWTRAADCEPQPTAALPTKVPEGITGPSSLARRPRVPTLRHHRGQPPACSLTHSLGGRLARPVIVRASLPDWRPRTTLRASAAAPCMRSPMTEPRVSAWRSGRRELRHRAPHPDAVAEHHPTRVAGPRPRSPRPPRRRRFRRDGAARSQRAYEGPRRANDRPRSTRTPAEEKGRGAGPSVCVLTASRRARSRRGRPGTVARRPTEAGPLPGRQEGEPVAQLADDHDPCRPNGLGL